jgi:hypothetical protein
VKLLTATPSRVDGRPRFKLHPVTPVGVMAVAVSKRASEEDVGYA